ncbi:hypothetical protein FF1_043177 [Malus domestica]|uniref:Uncharacterized protein n=1 Tax=Malus domestica TaxID=3750 RepID=A0A498JC85_MALDO|nr:hypothetical protein DVH24_020737 [Malus domestica]
MFCKTLESRVSNREAKSNEFKKSQEEFKISQAKFRTEFKTTTDLILLQLKLLAEKLDVESSAATPTHQSFIKSTSPLSLEKSNEIVLKLQSFHKEKKDELPSTQPILENKVGFQLIVSVGSGIDLEVFEDAIDVLEHNMEKDEEIAGAFMIGDKDPLSVDDYLVLSEIEAEKGRNKSV